MKIHPVAEIFPRIHGEDFVALKADIRKNGLLEAIWTYQGEIIEGRNRYYACSETGVEPRFREPLCIRLYHPLKLNGLKL